MNIPFDFGFLYLGNHSLDLGQNDKKLLKALLAASKKAVTRKWLCVEPPQLLDWYDIVHEISIVEKLTYSLRIQIGKFCQIRSM